MSNSARGEEFEHLIMQGNLDAVLQSVSVDEVAEAWCRFTARSRGERGDDDPDWWAIAFAMTAGMEGHPVVRPLLLALVDAAPNERVVGGIGAGPLEDFISDNEDDLAWLESQAASRPKLANAVRGSWVAGSVSESTLARLDRIAGEPLDRPRPREEWSPELVELDAATDNLVRLLDSSLLDHESSAVVDRYFSATQPFQAARADDDAPDNVAPGDDRN